MSYYDSDTASALGALDQLAAADERAYGTALLRRMSMQGNLLRDYPTVLASMAWPLGVDGVRYEVRLPTDAWLPLLPLSTPWWPAHRAYEARLRVEMPAGQVARFRLQTGDEVSVTGTGALQTVSLTGAVESRDRARDWLLEARLDEATSATAPTAEVITSGGTNPITVGGNDLIWSDRAVFPAIAFNYATLREGGYAIVFADGAGNEIFRRDIRDAGQDAVFYDRLVSRVQTSQVVSGATAAIIAPGPLTIASVHLVGGEP